jgi:small subunit ribosomal protein S18
VSDYDRGGRGERGGGGDRFDRSRRPRRGDNGDEGGGEFSPRPRRSRRGGNDYCPEGKCFDYKDVDTLERFVNEVGKIKPRRQTGNCARCQRELAREVKRARILGLLPYIANTD